MLKNKLENFLAVALIFLLMTGWFFSGWPRIWQEPLVPSEVKTVEASPDTEYKKPQTVTDHQTKWTDEANIYDGDHNEQSTYGYNDAVFASFDPYLTIDNWEARGQTYTATALKVNWKTNGSFTQNQFAIQGTKNGGGNWFDIVAMGLHTDTTIQTSSANLDNNQDLTQVKVKVVADREKGGDSGAVYIYDVWTEGEYTANADPTVSSVNLTLPSSLIENSTTTATCTATIIDTDGGNTIDYATATIYRSGVGSSCEADNNHCYRYSDVAIYATSSSDNNFYATWTVPIWFHADPTDAGTYSEETWQCYVIAEDNQGATGNGTDGDPPELSTLNAVIITSSIDYGVLSAGATSTNSQTTLATTTGNAALDLLASSTDMYYGAVVLPGNKQAWSLSDVAYESMTACSTTSYETIHAVLDKPYSSPSTSTDTIYWRIGIPLGQDLGTYYSTTSIVATPDT